MCLKRCRDRVTHMTLDPSLFTSFLLIYHPLLFYEIICSTHFSRLLHAQCISTCAIMTTLYKRRALYNPMSINPKIRLCYDVYTWQICQIIPQSSGSAEFLHKTLHGGHQFGRPLNTRAHDSETKWSTLSL